MKNANNKNDYLGGAAIAAGGFGCVFLPALKCKGEERPTGKVVSKLLTKGNADDEFNEAKEIQQILKTGLGESTYNEYFIFPEKQCTPDVLTKDDLINYDKKCKNLTKKGFTEKTINQNLTSVGIIELPNGGSDLDKTIKTMKSPKEFKEFNRSAINLLTKAVVPMNKLGVAHFDLKSPNILIDDNKQMRIIDWGLSLINEKSSVPSGALSRPVQYNLPFGAVLFNNSIIATINNKLKKIQFNVYENYKQELKTQISTIMYDIVIYNFKKEDGHIPYVSSSLEKHFNMKGNTGFMYFLCNLFTNYLTEAVINFINPSTKKFDALKYFNDVVMKNCDVWGFITIYDDILSNNKHLSNVYRNRLKAVVYKYLYSTEYAAEPIDINILTDDLKHIFPFNDKIKTPPVSNNDIQPKNVTSKSKKNSTSKTRALERAAKILRGSEKNVFTNNNKTKKQKNKPTRPPPLPPQEARLFRDSKDNFLAKIKEGTQNAAMEEKRLKALEMVYEKHVKANPVIKNDKKVVISANKISSTKARNFRNKLFKCPNGTRRNKKTGECEPTNNNSKFTANKTVRCPNGTRRNKKTGECEPITDNKTKPVKKLGLFGQVLANANKDIPDNKQLAANKQPVADDQSVANTDSGSLFARLGF